MNLTYQNGIALLQWYLANKREMPWRDTGNAYDVWLSEIMLQQTRIEAVKPKYIAFKKALPTIESLSQCNDEKLMKLWEGLGYYSRARNLKKCAITLVEQYDGKLPQDVSTLKKLPGIGPYTAGAISSIAYNQIASAVDGNVLRILARVFLDSRDIRMQEVRKDYEDVILAFLTEYQNDLLKYDAEANAHITQGLMELGETICIPNGKPNCTLCPLADGCKAHQTHATDQIPYRSALKERKIVPRTLFIIRDGDRFLLHKRQAKGLLAGLYEFPGIDQHLNKSQIGKQIEKLGLEALKVNLLPTSKHIFTHLEWHMQAYEVFVSNIDVLQSDEYLLLTKKELQQFAIPSAFKKYIEYYSLKE